MSAATRDRREHRDREVDRAVHVKTTAQATKTHASAQANIAATERVRSARATATPGSSTTNVPKASRRYSIIGSRERAPGVAGREEADARRGTRSRRSTSARSRNDQSSSRRARSASFRPLCLARKRRCPRRFSTYSCPRARRRRRARPRRPGRTAPSSRRGGSGQPVDLLAEHEEVLVEEPDRVGRLAPHEQRRAVEPVDLGASRRGRSRRGRAGSARRVCGASLRMKRYSVASRQSVGSPRTERCSVPSGLSSLGPTTAASGCASANATSRSSPSPSTQASELRRKK